MSKEFNYDRYWRQHVNPVFAKLLMDNLSVERAWNQAQKEAEVIKQVGSSKTVEGHTDYLMALVDAIPTDICIQAMCLGHDYGHMSPIRKHKSQANGLYWKFESLCSMSLLNRKPYPGEAMIKANNELDAMCKTFYDHKEGTKFDNEEMAEILRVKYADLIKDIFSIEKVADVNHKPDIFCTTSKHIQLSQGMYLDPSVAPCGHCGEPYSKHTHETACIVKLASPDLITDNKLTEPVQKVLLRLADAFKDEGFKIDGFGFAK